MRSSSTEALSRIKVLDLCRVVSGPVAMIHRGDLGPDVVKIEDPVSATKVAAMPSVRQRGELVLPVGQPQQEKLRNREIAGRP